MKTTIYIDDTGTPSQSSKSKYDTGDWSSWSSIILKPEHKTIYECKANELLKEHKIKYGIKEFHFADILSGKKPFRKVSLNDRLEIFIKFAALYRLCEAPIIVQSMTSDDMLRNRTPYLRYLKMDNFDFSRHSDAALWFLLDKTANFLKSNAHYSLPAEIYIDEGRQKPGTSQKVKILEGLCANSEVKYISSHNEVLIQLIDFIAFCVNRMRWILMNEKKSSLDVELLRIFTFAKFNITNLEKIEYDEASYTTEEYDNHLRKTYNQNGNLSDEELKRIKDFEKKNLKK